MGQLERRSAYQVAKNALPECSHLDVWLSEGFGLPSHCDAGEEPREHRRWFIECKVAGRSFMQCAPSLGEAVGLVRKWIDAAIRDARVVLAAHGDQAERLREMALAAHDGGKEPEPYDGLS